MSPYPYVLTLPQDIHERILVDELEKIGGEISWKQELLRFKDDGDSVIATINTPDGEITKTFAYICGCDGASSVVRKALDIDFLVEHTVNHSL